MENGDSGDGVTGAWLCAEGGSGRRKAEPEDGVTGRGEGRSGVHPGGTGECKDMPRAVLVVTAVVARCIASCVRMGSATAMDRNRKTGNESVAGGRRQYDLGWLVTR